MSLSNFLFVFGVLAYVVHSDSESSDDDDVDCLLYDTCLVGIRNESLELSLQMTCSDEGALLWGYDSADCSGTPLGNLTLLSECPPSCGGWVRLIVYIDDGECDAATDDHAFYVVPTGCMESETVVDEEEDYGNPLSDLDEGGQSARISCDADSVSFAFWNSSSSCSGNPDGEVVLIEGCPGSLEISAGDTSATINNFMDFHVECRASAISLGVAAMLGAFLLSML